VGAGHRVWLRATAGTCGRADVELVSWDAQLERLVVRLVRPEVCHLDGRLPRGLGGPQDPASLPSVYSSPPSMCKPEKCDQIRAVVPTPSGVSTTSATATSSTLHSLRGSSR